MKINDNQFRYESRTPPEAKMTPSAGRIIALIVPAAMNIHDQRCSRRASACIVRTVGPEVVAETLGNPLLEPPQGDRRARSTCGVDLERGQS